MLYLIYGATERHLPPSPPLRGHQRAVCIPPEASTTNRTAGTACEQHASPRAAPHEAADPPCEERRQRRLVRQVAVHRCRLLHGLDACRWPGRTRKQERDYTRARAEKPGPWGEEARARARRARRVHLGRQRTSEASRSHCSRIVQAASVKWKPSKRVVGGSQLFCHPSKAPPVKPVKYCCPQAPALQESLDEPLP